ncbi:15334_t:CDS:2, partial [Funneliformis caledonium]
INLSPKKKCEEKNDILLVAMKMLKAQLRHLPLGFNTTHKLYQFHYCDAANYPVTVTMSLNTCIVSHSYATVVEPENNIPCDGNDDESEPIKYVAYALEEALRKFQQQ